ncbi:hypothetical protein [Marivita sp. GX14005]|uniref:hypothetical protein n=1 Tax=Marivita sp. GX14005 TaxID=2942276 RepID=UPI0020196EA3|nr:hypothetical protein [Marivita sp. GX14005]MCL3883589.1 hypothetical protein [Marivita sp. GX14005]
MKRTFRKQNRDDFLTRIERLDPKFAATPTKTRLERKPWEVERTGAGSQSPLLMLGTGFGLVGGAIFALRNPDRVLDALAAAGWPAQFLDYATYGMLFLLLCLAIFFAKTLFRLVKPRTPGKLNAGGLIAGAIAAIAFFSVPDTVYQAGYELAGFEDANDMFTYAQTHGQKLTKIDWASVVPVSSTAK